MARVKKELTRELRARIKALFDAGWSYCRIDKDLKCSPITVKYTLDRHDATNSHQNRKGRGRRKKQLSDRRVKHLKILSLRDRRKTSRELRDEINTTMTNGATVSSRTVRRKLGEEGLVGRIAAKKPLLREQNRVKRLIFAKEHKRWTKEDWYKVLWTDGPVNVFFEPNENFTTDDGLEIEECLVNVHRGSCTRITIPVTNRTQHLSRVGASLGKLQIISSVVPGEIAQLDSPSLQTQDGNNSTGEGIHDSKDFISEMDMSGLTPSQQAQAKTLLREERNAFA